jgi:hypothetical protein
LAESDNKFSVHFSEEEEEEGIKTIVVHADMSDNDGKSSISLSVMFKRLDFGFGKES